MVILTLEPRMRIFELLATIFCDHNLPPIKKRTSETF
ncbi:hypothetical protein H206_06075 [Candidatus Electrothrix aarhusensis]|uniref:Uncharacterized protein n=1 Tax=Candidatus Electrothrix aarhusensis TaxID=1859131 RepID=A0A444J1E9_9BACT|nr:hypothetical protein H206_06075 [Candidatus Electrothrix aarhusensis]